MSALYQCSDKLLQFINEGRLDHNQPSGLRSRAQLIDQGMQAACILPALILDRLALQAFVAWPGAAVMHP